MSPTMLIIDDDDAFASNAAHFLARGAWQIEVSREIPGATARLSAGVYDVVLLDVALTGVSIGSGIALVETARRLQPEATVVVISAFGSPEIVASARLRGADGFLHKPMSFDSIEAGVLDLVGQAR